MSDRSSAQKKRDRDRRAQQNLRDKKLRHTVKLEAQVAHCEQYHNDIGVQNLLGTIDSLRKKNEALVARQKALRSLIGSWDETLEDTGSSNSPLGQDTSNEHTARSVPQALEPLGNSEILSIAGNLEYSIPSSSSPGSLTQVPGVYSIELASPWNELPLCSDNPTRVQSLTVPWLAYPDLVAQCPDTPESPLDLLYGSKTNMLANMIHTTIERRPVRDPERLAMGWMAYHFSKWILEPSPRTFARLPRFLRPFKEQFEVEHPIAISLVPYPKLRSNLINQWPLYENNRDDLFGLLACSIKIRWPWGMKILDRDENNEIRIKPAFYQTIMKEEGWGLMQEFMKKYPHLMAGIETDHLVFKIT